MAKDRSPSPIRSRSPSKRRKHSSHSSHKSSRRDFSDEEHREKYDRHKEKSRHSERKDDALRDNARDKKSSRRSRSRSTRRDSHRSTDRSKEKERSYRRSRSRSPRKDSHRSHDKDRDSGSRKIRHRRSRENSRERSPKRDRERSDRSDKKDRSENSRSERSSNDTHHKDHKDSQERNRSSHSSRSHHDTALSESINLESSNSSEKIEPVGLSSTVQTLLDSQEEKIRQRRERVEKWRKEKEEARLREKEQSDNGAPETVSTKVWSLEDDEDDEEPFAVQESPNNNESSEKPIASNGNTPNTLDSQTEKKEIKPLVVQDESDEDTLDAYMQDIVAEAKKLTKQDFEKLQAKKPESRTMVRVNLEDEEVESEESEPEDILALAAKRLRKKDVPMIDHAKALYEPFRKDFYIEPSETQNMSKEQVEDFRAELDGIKIRGVDCPKPVKRWTHCGFPTGCLEVIRHQNFISPTPIQAQAIPAIMSGRDVIGVAKTGSGKTLAFLLPMFRHIRDQRPLDNGEGPIAVIMTPTRELASQIHKECKPFLKVLSLRAVCVYGGTGMQSQINDIKRGAEIVVCTPGRMIDLLCANSGRLINLARVTMLVLDEADRMFDMGFEPQVMKIVNNVRPDRQTVLFSATFPRQMEALARKILHKPLEITVGGRSIVCDDVNQIVEVREERTKFLRLLEILGNFYQTDADEEKCTLIFVDRHEAADNLLRDLIHKGYPCLSLHGGKDQVDRDATISDFKSGVCHILIATSIAARGLDVKNLALVVNYECPNHMEDYVHRVGRTGRAGNKGTAYTFITPAQDKYANDIVKALKSSNSVVSPELQALVDEFQNKVKTGNAHQAGSGFGGKGLETLDKQRDMVKLVQKKTYGNDEDNESSSDEEVAPTQASTTENVGAGVASALAAKMATPDSNQAAAAIRAAQLAAARVNPAVAPARLKEAIAEINAKFRGDPNLVSELLDQLNPPQVFTQEIEINDYPQKARWRVTNKEQINLITEHTGAAVTTRGEYIPNPDSLPPNSTRRKLHLFIEAETQLAIDLAVREIRSLLKEATLLAFEAESRSSSAGGALTGRYSVL